MTGPVDRLLAQARSATGRAGDAAGRALRDVRLYLASPEGRRRREGVAKVLAAAAPAIAAVPALRRSRVVRLLGVAGAATLLAKLAEAVRDWEPVPHEPA